MPAEVIAVVVERAQALYVVSGLVFWGCTLLGKAVEGRHPAVQKGWLNMTF